MGVPSGLGAQLGAKRETVFGTFVVPDAFYEFDSESLALQPNYLTSTGLRAGRMAPPAARHKKTTRLASGDITMKVPTKGFGRWLDLLHGNVVTPEKIGAGTAYKQVHNIGTSAPLGKSLTVQIGKPDVAGVVQPLSYPGAKVTQLALSCATGAELMATLGISARDEVPSEALATASYPTGIESLDFVSGEVKVGADTLGIVGSAGLTIPLPMKTDRFGLNKSALAAEPLPNDYIKPMGTMAMEFLGLTQLNHFYNCDNVKVVLLFEGSVVSEANKAKLELVVPAAHFVGASPQVGGPDVLGVEYPFEAYDNGTEAPVIATYVSADTAL
jgi:Phage tail tube protein